MTNNEFKNQDDAAMPLLEHLGELRKRIIRFLIVMVIITLVSYGFRKDILDYIRKPVEGPLKKYTALASKKKQEQNLINQSNLFNCSCEEVKATTSNKPENISKSENNVLENSQEISTKNVHQKSVKPIKLDQKQDKALVDKKEMISWYQAVKNTFRDFWVYFQVLTGKDLNSIEGLAELEPETELIVQPNQPLPGKINLNCSCEVNSAVNESDSSHSSMVFIGIYELFFAQMKVAILTGLFLSFPYLLIELWGFVGPALYKGEKKIFWFFSFFSYLFFIGGAIFGYSVVFPFGFDFFLSLTQVGEIMPSLSVGEYLNFAIKLLLAFGFIFEMPLVVFILARLGLVTPKMMIKNSKVAIVVICIVSAVITPPDPLTMGLMAGPLTALYLLSIGVCYFGLNRSKAALREQGVNPDDFEE